MNKTSVELFQLYDDHRKKGMQVPTEKEFRGYYALLKLDKHPGYKMTPEIRQTPEILFARDVARACRTGNFIAFFRLARKASYLQACLMHAHFAKEDNIENLLEYHGFVIKEFEEPYMVKEGLFLNSDNDYPVKCSKLVHMKKSRRTVEDVSSPHTIVSLPAEEEREVQLVKVYEKESKPVQFNGTESHAQVIDEEMDDYEAVPSPKDGTQVKPMVKPLVIGQQSEDVFRIDTISPLARDFSLAHNSPKSQQARVGSTGKPNFDPVFQNSLERKTHSDTKAVPLEIMSERVGQEKIASFEFDSAMENYVPQKVFIEDLEDEEHTDYQDVETEEVEPSYHDEDAAEAKLKLIFRLWKRRSSKKRELREQRQLSAMAALNSLSMGPPIRQNIDQPSTSGVFNINRVMHERYERHERSWSRLNVSDVIAATLNERNPAAKCFCWKIILCSQTDNPDGDRLQQLSQVAHFTAGSWLHSKLIPTSKGDDDVIISSPGLSIWKKWVPSQSGGDTTCCLSIVRDAKLDDTNEILLGANAVLFLVSGSISLEIQKFRLHNLLMSLPSGSQLPLLIVIDSYEENSDSSSIMAERLGLHDIDNSRWLACQSPLQPIVSCVNMRELTLTHLNSSLKVLDEMSDYEVGPDHCISAFNEASHQTVGKVAAAADANPASWPCSEIALLEKTSKEYEAVKLYLPDIGWSSSARIELLICALRDCRLPSFHDDISWLYRGSNLGEDIEKQKQKLEDCLIRYLTQLSKMMGLSLATNEARVMLQKGARLELHNSTYYIILKWVMIFQRVFNWRLMSLSNGAFSSAYILEQLDTDISKTGLDMPGIQGMVSSSYYLTHPSLDEMVEVSYGSFASSMGHTEDKAFQPPSAMVSNGSIVQATNAAQNGNLSETNNDNYIEHGSTETSSRLVVATREADKLSKLLEQCNMLQDRIDNKLSIYF
ncbi:hypothetical protein TEA_026135 [Camellia sinensis var. sinensis]|uniref:SAC3/GANP/THP3 conserved domain-containing protein n=1 Tax=Camellia sinensis var. sinensis TaxID=542762 RepID=A0A4V3WNR6_CAMSN|nr:hypothetical protein TEA_026135 [Camellia sinensis var. sinensis]